MRGEPQVQVFGDWHPDLPANGNPGALLAKNVIPRAKSYRDFPSLSAFSDALAAACRGTFWARASDRSIYNFAGDAGALYELTGGTSWSDVSQAMTTYSADYWDWVQFNDRIIATDGGATALQYFDMGTSTEFADLPGSPPRFKALAQVRDFVVGANYTLGSEVEPGGIAWSGFNNSELWTPSLSTQSNRIPSKGAGGQVQRLISGERGIAIRENSIATIEYVGPPVVLDLSEPFVNHGTQAPRSVVTTRQWVFYYSTEGFMQMNRQTLEITPIGAGKVNNWFQAEVANNDIINIVGAVDRGRGLVFWAFRTSSSSVPYNRIIVYNWVFKRWAYAVINTQWIAEFSSVSADLDTLDSVLGGNIDTASIPVDSDAYIGGALTLFGFNSSNIACTFDGPSLVGELDTAEFSLPVGKRAGINKVVPIFEGAPTLVEVAPITRNLPYGNPVVGSYSAVDETGAAKYRSNARYNRFRLRVNGSFDHVQRLEYYVKQRGSR